MSNVPSKRSPDSEALYFCPSCVTPATVVPKKQRYSWMIELECNNEICERTYWWSCNACGSKVALDGQSKITRHNNDIHRPQQSQTATRMDALDHDSFVSFPDDYPTDFGLTGSTNTAQVDVPIKINNFGRQQSARYFEYDLNGNGPRHLVAMACTHLPEMELEKEDVELHLALTELCYLLSRNERDLFAKVLKQVVTFTKQKQYHILKNTADPKHQVPFHTDIPTTKEQMRRFYMEGDHAILNNLPHPHVQEIESHAYVSLYEIIRDILAKGIPLDGNSSLMSVESSSSMGVTRIVESRCYKAIFERARAMYPNEQNLLVLWINEWSDDFEPNHIKSNRGSVWLKTVTISCPHTSKHSIENTYPIALGRKGDSHEAIEIKFSEELCSLSGKSEKQNNLFYQKGKSCMVQVYAELFASLQDQPEQRSANHLLAGNSLYHARWGYSMDMGAIQDYLPACSECLIGMIEGTWNTNAVCTQCLNWSIKGNSRLLHFEPPDNFPKDELNASGKLQPLCLSYKQLCSAVEKARQQLESNAWTLSNAEAYLRIHCLTDNTISDVLEAANLRGLLAAAQEHAEAECDFLSMLQNEKPDCFIDCKLPALWQRPVQLHQHIDVIMHLLFLGVQKTLAHLVRDWAKMKGKNSEFQQFACNILQSIPHVPWCPVAPYTGDRLGGWVSENFLALARLTKWFYGALDKVAAVDTPYKEPTIPHHKWLKGMCIDWLEAHGITFESMLDTTVSASEKLQTSCQDYVSKRMPLKKADAKTLRSMVATYKDSPTSSIPALVKDQLCSVSNIINLTQAWQVLVAKIMSTEAATEESICDIDQHIKIFLTLFARVDKSMNGGKKNYIPKFRSSYNFACLLNLPDLIREFGPLRNLWEGAAQGEGFIQVLKPELSMGLRKNWHVAKMERLLKWKGLRSIMELTLDVSLDDAPKAKLSANLFVYKDLLSATKAYTCRYPLSAIALVDGKYGMVVRESNTMHFAALERKHYDSCVNGCHYHHWDLDVKSGLHELEEQIVEEYVILLPMLNGEGLPGNGQDPVYTVITSNWNEIDNVGCICQPELQINVSTI